MYGICIDKMVDTSPFWRYNVSVKIPDVWQRTRAKMERNGPSKRDAQHPLQTENLIEKVICYREERRVYRGLNPANSPKDKRIFLAKISRGTSKNVAHLLSVLEVSGLRFFVASGLAE